MKAKLIHLDRTDVHYSLARLHGQEARRDCYLGKDIISSSLVTGLDDEGSEGVELYPWLVQYSGK